MLQRPAVLWSILPSESKQPSVLLLSATLQISVDSGRVLHSGEPLILLEHALCLLQHLPESALCQYLQFLGHRDIVRCVHMMPLSLTLDD